MITPSHPRAFLTPNAGTALVGVGCVAIAAMATGGAGAASAAVGVAVAVAYFATGPIALRIAGAAEAASAAGTWLLLLTYTLRLTLVVAILGIAGDIDGLHARALGLTLFACAFCWPACQFVRLLRTPTPLVSPPRPDLSRLDPDGQELAGGL